jgi:hypothetical protein
LSEALPWRVPSSHRFQQGNDQVNARKQRLASLPKVLNFSIMDISIEFPVGVKTIRANHASQLNIVLNKAVEGFSIKVLDQGNTDAPFRLTLNSIDARS